MVYNFFDKIPGSLAQSEALWSKTLGTRATRDKSASGSRIKNENISNQELAKDLHEQIIRKFMKRKVLIEKYSILDSDLADMKLTSKFNEGIRFLLCVIDISSK